MSIVRHSAPLSADDGLRQYRRKNILPGCTAAAFRRVADARPPCYVNERAAK